MHYGSGGTPSPGQVGQSYPCRRPSAHFMLEGDCRSLAGIRLVMAQSSGEGFRGSAPTLRLSSSFHPSVLWFSSSASMITAFCPNMIVPCVRFVGFREVSAWDKVHKFPFLVLGDGYLTRIMEMVVRPHGNGVIGLAVSFCLTPYES